VQKQILRCAQDDGVTATATAKAKPNRTANAKVNGPVKGGRYSWRG